MKQAPLAVTGNYLWPRDLKSLRAETNKFLQLEMSEPKLYSVMS